MTNPIGGGAPNLSYDNQSVTANLKLDIPTGSVDILKEVSRYTGDIQANLEAAARFGGEYMSYLKSFPEIQRQVNDIQRETLQLIRDSASAMEQLRAASGGYGMGAMAGAPFGPTTQYYGQMGMGYGAADRYNDVRSVPQEVQQQQMTASSESQQQSRDSATYNYIQSFGGVPGSNIYPVGPGLSYATFTMGGATGIPAEPLFRNLDGGSGERREAEVKRQQAVRDRLGGKPFGKHAHPDDIAEADEEDNEAPSTARRGRKKVNAADSIKGGEHNLSTANSIFQNLMGAVGSDDTPVSGRASLVGSLLKSLGTIPGLGALAKGGLVAGGLAMGFNMVQNVGEKIQSYRNQDLYDHTLGGGMQVEKDVMLMSLNPLLSTEQSREIIMAALRSGGPQGSKAYSSAVDFIKDNLIQMNMSVSESVQFLQSNVNLGKQSVESLGLALSELKNSNAAKTGTIAGATKSAETYNAILTGLNISGEKSLANSTALANIFSSPQAGGEAGPLGKSVDGGVNAGTKIVASLISNEGFVGFMGSQVAPGVRPDMVLQKLAENGQFGVTEGVLQTLAIIAMRWFSAYPDDPDTAKKNFFYDLQRLGAKDVTEQETSALYDLLISKGWTQLLKETKENTQQGTQITVHGTPITSQTPTFVQWLADPKHKGKSAADYYKDVFGGYKEMSEADTDLFKKKVEDVASKLGVDVKKMGVYYPADDKIYQINPYNDQQIIGIMNGSLKLVATDTDMGWAVPTNEAITNPIGVRAASQVLDGKSHIRSDLLGPEVFGSPEGDYGQVGPENKFGKVTGGLVPKDGGRSITYGDTTPPDTGARVTVDLTPEAKKLIQQLPNQGQVPTDPNSINSNYGYNGSQRNSAAPGNRPR